MGWLQLFREWLTREPEKVVAQFKTTDKGVQLIKDFEGLRLNKYRDAAGHWTIGYGHKLTREELVKGLVHVTKVRAEEILIEDIIIHEKRLNAFPSSSRT